MALRPPLAPGQQGYNDPWFKLSADGTKYEPCDPAFYSKDWPEWSKASCLADPHQCTLSCTDVAALAAEGKGARGATDAYNRMLDPRFGTDIGTLQSAGGAGGGLRSTGGLTQEFWWSNEQNLRDLISTSGQFYTETTYGGDQLLLRAMDLHNRFSYNALRIATEEVRKEQDRVYAEIGKAERIREESRVSGAIAMGIGAIVGIFTGGLGMVGATQTAAGAINTARKKSGEITGDISQYISNLESALTILGSEVNRLASAVPAKVDYPFRGIYRDTFIPSKPDSRTRQIGVAPVPPGVEFWYRNLTEAAI